MMPYIYTLAWQTSRTGQPIVQPFFWTDPYNADYWNISDQFFLGPDLMVAPVTKEGARKRKVIFPEGIWYSFWDQSVFEGPAELTIEAALDSIPVFVRAGAIIPLENDKLELHIYPGSRTNSEHVLYSDSGDGYGPHRVDTFHLTAIDDSIEMSWRQEGDYPYPYTETEIHLHGQSPRTINVDGRDHKPDTPPVLKHPFQKIRFDL
jgi:alpha-glucosidase